MWGQLLLQVEMCHRGRGITTRQLSCTRGLTFLGSAQVKVSMSPLRTPWARKTKSRLQSSLRDLYSPLTSVSGPYWNSLAGGLGVPYL